MNTEKYTPEMESKYIDILRKLLLDHKYQYQYEIKSKKYLDLMEFIVYKTPLLNDSFYKLSTKVYWVLNDIKDFPKCHYCGKPFIYVNSSATGNYPTFCSASCRNKSNEFKNARRTTLIEHFGSMENFLKYKHEKGKQTIIENYGSIEEYERARRINYNKTLIKRYGSDKYRSEWTEKSKRTCLERYGVDSFSKTPEFRKLSSKIWKHIWENMEFRTKMSKLMKQQYNSIVKKIIETNLRRYGVEFYFSSKQARTYRRNMTEYDGIIFDSKLEIQFYSWCIENGLKVQVHPELYFDYDDGGVKRKYYPDFIVNDTIVVETKGCHFFRTNQVGELEMFLPFRYDFWDEDTYAKHCKTMNNKYRCMLEHGVLIVTEKDMKTLDKALFLSSSR